MRASSVLISGVGIAGPALAHLLMRAGFQPTLVERAPELRTSGYVIDLWGRGYELLEQMGLMPQVQRAGYHVREVRLVDARGARVGGFCADALRSASGGSFVSVRRGDLAAILYHSVASRCETLWGDSVDHLEQAEDGVRVHFRHARPRRFDLVIGADGLHSRVRELTFGPQASFERYLGYTVAAFDAKGYRPREEGVYVAYAVPGHQAARFSMHDDRTMFLLVTADADASALDVRSTPGQKAHEREQFAQLGWECPQIMAALRSCDNPYFDRVSQICMPQWHKGRVCLIGDAAFAPSLLAGQGAALAIMAAHVLAGELANDPEPGRAFTRYEARLRAFMERKQLAARRFASSFVPRTRWGLVLRNLASRALDLPGLAAWSMAASLRDDVIIPDYSRAEARAYARNVDRTSMLSGSHSVSKPN